MHFRRYLNFLDFFAFFLVFSVEVNAQWETVHHPIQPYDSIGWIYDIDFHSPKTGFAACMGIPRYPLKQGGSIVFTEDSGINWSTRFFIDSFNLRQVHILTKDIIVATGLHTGYDWTIVNEGIFIKSIDNGLNWDTTYLPFLPSSFESINDSIFILSGTDFSFSPYKPIFLKSIDQGSSWDTLSSTSTGQAGYDITFITDSIGLMLGGNGKIFRTEDQGNIFSTTILDSTTALSFINLSLSNSGRVYLLAKDYQDTKLIIYSSSDSAKSWTKISSSSNFSTLYRLEFANDSVGYITGQFKILKTIDGGLSWHQQSSSPPSNGDFFDDLNDIVVFSEDVTYAAGWFGQFYRTFNGGDTPTSINEVNNLSSNIKVYPNPAKEQLFISYKGNEQLQIQLYNLVGQSLELIDWSSSGAETPHRYKYSIAHLPKGIYLLEIIAGEERISRKIIKH